MPGQAIGLVSDVIRLRENLSTFLLCNRYQESLYRGFAEAFGSEMWRSKRRGRVSLELKLALQMTPLKYRVLSVLDANVQPALSAVQRNQFSRI